MFADIEQNVQAITPVIDACSLYIQPVVADVPIVNIDRLLVRVMYFTGTFIATASLWEI